MNNFYHFLPSAGVGGAPINVMRLILNSNKKKFKHTIYIPNDNEDYIQKLKYHNIDFIVIPKIRIGLFRFFIEILKIKIKDKESFIITHGRGASLIIRPITILLNMKSIHFYRGFTKSYGIKNIFLPKILILIDKYLCRYGITIAVGIDEKKIIKRYLSPKRLVKIRNPVPEILWNKNNKAFDYDFAFIGRRSLQKGYDNAILLSKKNPDSKFLWVGAKEGNQFKNHKIPSNFKVCNYMQQDEIFNSASIILCTSRWEGCSTVITECIKSTKPFLSLHCNGVSEFNICGINENNFYDSIEEMNEGIINICHEIQIEIANNLNAYLKKELCYESNIKKFYDYAKEYKKIL